MLINSINRTISMMGQLLDPRKSTVPMIDLPSNKPSCSGGGVKQPLPRIKPEAAGVSSAHIEAFVREVLADKTIRMHGLMILRGGKVIYETSFGNQDLSVWKYTFSACKSVTSLAVGMLIDEGKLRLEDRIIDLFPEKATAVNRLWMKDVTVRHLLTMSSTILFNEAGSAIAADWLAGFFESVTVGEVGKNFMYNSMNTYLLAAIVCKVSGETMSSYLERKLFKPLGINEYYWETCPDGIEKGGWGLYIRPEEMAKIGQLVLNKGRWKRKRIVSAEWIKMATTAYMTAPESYGDFNYGFQIWVGRTQRTFLFSGMLGQDVLGFWDNNILLVSNAANDELFQQSNYFKIAQKYFGQSFDRALPENEKDYASLCGLSTGQGYEQPLPKECEWLCRMKMHAQDDLALPTGLVPLVLQAVQNRYTKGLDGIDFSVDEGKLILHYTETEQVYHVPIGFGRGAISEVMVGDIPFLVSALGRFSTDEDDHPVFQVMIDFLETPCSRKIKLYFLDEETVLLKQEELPGDGFVHQLLRAAIGLIERRPVIGAAINKMDQDLVDYKIDKLFVPEIKMTVMINNEETQ